MLKLIVGLHAALIVLALASTAHADGPALGPGPSVAAVCARSSIDKAQVARPPHCRARRVKARLRKPYTQIVAVDFDGATYLGVRKGRDWYLAPLSDDHVAITRVAITKDGIVVTARGATWRCSLDEDGAPNCTQD